MNHPSWIEIDLLQFQKNVALVRNHIGKRLLCLPVKANAYGHGLTLLGKAAQEAGVDYLATSNLQEAVTLRQAGVTIPILVLGAIHEDQIPNLLSYDLEFSISSLFKAKLVAHICQKTDQRCKVHMEIDTGMQRTGVRPETAPALFQYLTQEKCFTVVGVYSHLATSDDPQNPFTQKQIDLFQSTLLQSPFKNHTFISHLANSGGAAHFPNSLLDMVRPALLTLGYASSSILGIKPFFSLKSKVSYFKVVAAGEGISYGHSYRTTKQTRIVTIPIGYGDGYRRALSNQGSVLIRGKRFPIVGTICMDQFMVDVGDSEVFVGDEVVLIGKQGSLEIPLHEISTLCNTIDYEVLCFFNERIPRISHQRV